MARRAQKVCRHCGATVKWGIGRHAGLGMSYGWFHVPTSKDPPPCDKIAQPVNRSEYHKSRKENADA